MTRKGLGETSVNSSQESLQRIETLPQETYPYTPNADINCAFVPKPSAVPSYVVWGAQPPSWGSHTFREVVWDLCTALSKLQCQLLYHAFEHRTMLNTYEHFPFHKNTQFPEKPDPSSLPQRLPFAQHLSGIWSTLPGTRMTIVWGPYLWFLEGCLQPSRCF